MEMKIGGLKLECLTAGESASGFQVSSDGLSRHVSEQVGTTEQAVSFVTFPRPLRTIITATAGWKSLEQGKVARSRRMGWTSMLPQPPV